MPPTEQMSTMGVERTIAAAMGPKVIDEVPWIPSVGRVTFAILVGEFE